MTKRKRYIRRKRYITIFGARMAIGSPIYKWMVKNKRRLLGELAKRKPGPQPQPQPQPGPGPIVDPHPTTMFMFDDVNVDLIPRNAQAVAGYVGGHYLTWPKIVERFPHAHKLSIAIAATENAMCLDVEPRDATVAEAAAWVKRQHARGQKRPVLYTSASQGQRLVDACSKAGLKYGTDYLWWSAHYTFHAHFCGPACGFGLKVHAHATQFTDKALGRSLDESIVAPGFFPPATRAV